MTDPRTDRRRVRARGLHPREPVRRERTFPPMIEYESLAGYPTPVRFALATVALPFEVAVTGVRLLKDVEVLLAELGAQLRALRPAVEALGDAYADGVVPLVDTAGDLVADVDESTRTVGGVVLAPITAVRDVLWRRGPEGDDTGSTAPDAGAGEAPDGGHGPGGPGPGLAEPTDAVADDDAGVLTRALRRAGLLSDRPGPPG